MHYHRILSCLFPVLFCSLLTFPAFCLVLPSFLHLFHMHLVSFLLRFRPVNTVLEKAIESASSHTSRENLEQLAQMLHRNRYQLESLFRYMDLNGDERISVREFKEGIVGLQHVLQYNFSEHDLELLIKHMDTNNDGYISYA